MRFISILMMLLATTTATAASRAPEEATADPHARVPEIIAAVLADDHVDQRLQELCDVVGPRLSGSAGMDRAVAWAAKTMRADGLENVRLDKVMVPHWVRGAEHAEVIDPWAAPLPILGLGGSVGTPPGGIVAEAMVVRDHDELIARSAEAVGKIVVFNQPWEGYGPTVQYRAHGADWASEHGAVACLIRSVTPATQGPPHTGVMRYEGGDSIPKIPAAALCVEDAARLERQHRRGLPLRLRLEMDAETLPDAESANVIGEIVGREFPEQIVLVGGHLDSWDVGTCAHDDGAGCILAMEVAHQLHKLDLRPRRTVRVVLFADEEQWQRGGKAYARDHADELAHHVAALESDSGAYEPAGWSVRGDSTLVDRLAELAAPLANLGADSVRPGWAGVDIGFIVEEGVPGIGHRTHNDPYFDYHHSPADTYDKVDPELLKKNAAAMTALVWLIAESKEPLR